MAMEGAKAVAVLAKGWALLCGGVLGGRSRVAVGAAAPKRGGPRAWKA